MSWRRVERMPLLLNDHTIAAERYAIIGIGAATATLSNYGASTFHEARAIAQRLRSNLAIHIVVIYRTEEAWRRRNVPPEKDITDA